MKLTLTPLTLGTLATVILAAASFGAGAVRHRGGVLDALGLSFLTFGHGRDVNLLLYWVGMFTLCAAWVWLGRSLHNVRRSLIAWTVPLLLAAPLASRDVYSYLMQGAMMRDGFDPYTEGAAVNPGPFLLEVSHDWRNTTTPYGPLHLWLAEGITRLVGDNVAWGIIAYKAVSVAGFALIAWTVPRIATHVGGNPTLALWFGVANPVMLLHLVGGMHNESVLVGLVSLGLLCALRRRFLVGIGLIAVATALKATAFIAMPFVLWIYLRPATKVRDFLLGGLLIVAETLAVVSAITWAAGSSWGWLSEISGNSKVINPLSGPTLLADILIIPNVTYNEVLATLRTGGLVLMLVGLVATWWWGRRQPIKGVTAAYAVAFVFNSVTLPWYYASIISLVGTGWRVPRVATGASLVVALSFSADGNHQLYNWWWMVGVIIAAWLATNWLKTPGRAE